MVICLELGADNAYCPADATASLASVKSRLVLPFLYWLTRVVPEKRPLNVCVCVCVIQPAFRSIANFWHILGTLLINQLTDDLATNLSCTVNELK